MDYIFRMQSKKLIIKRCDISMAVGRRLFLILWVLLAEIQPAHSATQGTLGSTSTGSVDISVTKPALARISNLSDLVVPVWVPGSGDVILTTDACVYSTRPMGGYTVKATGNGRRGGFTLQNNRYLLPYSVAWNDGGVGELTNTGSRLLAGITSKKFINASTDSSSCNGSNPGPTARLIVTIGESDLDSMKDGTYTGTITLLVTPN